MYLYSFNPRPQFYFSHAHCYSALQPTTIILWLIFVTMHPKHTRYLRYLLLLLGLFGLFQVASAGPNVADGHVARGLMSSFGMTKRANILVTEPMVSVHLRAKEASPGGEQKKRQVGGTCNPGHFPCKNFPGSCCMFLRTCELEYHNDN